MKKLKLPKFAVNDVTGEDLEHSKVVPNEATDSKHGVSEFVASATMDGKPDYLDQALTISQNWH